MECNIKEKLKEISISVILSTLFSGLAVSILIYFLTKSDNRRSWCIEETKSFNIYQYNKKDLLILIDECNDEITKYSLLEDILFESNNTNNLSSIINQLYVKNHINNTFITDFSDESLMKNIQNSNYNFDNTLINTQNNLPVLKKQISDFLLFTKEILFKSYSIEQQLNYFYLLLTIFKNDKLLYDNETPEFSIFKIQNNGIEPKVDEKLLNLQTICENMGKVDKNQFVVSSKNLLTNSMNELYNSYRNKNNKNKLIQKLNLLSISLINKRIMDVTTIKNQNKYMNEILNTEGLIQLVLLELNNYNLDEKELKTIFNEYKKTINFIDPFYKNLVNKLIYKLFDNDNLFTISNSVQLYNKLFFSAYKDGSIKINTELINFLAIKKNSIILTHILKISDTDKRLKREIFHAFIISQQINTYNVNYINTIKDIIKNESDIETKKLLIRDSLVLNNIELIELAIKYIKNHETYYVKELNQEDYFGGNFHTYSIFAYLSRSKPLWIAKQSYIKKVKVDLMIEFLSKIENNINKIYLLNSILSIAENDTSLIEKIKKEILNEKNLIVREKMLNILMSNKTSNIRPHE